MGCKLCGAGYFSDNAAFACVPCPAGRWNNTLGAESLEACMKCGPGRHGNNIQAATSESQCIKCEAGRYGPLEVGTGIWDCEDCEPGRFSGVLGRQTPCDGCLPGQFSMRIAAKTPCTSCPKGWSAENANSSVCDMCLPGFAQASVAQSSCKHCRGGRYSAHPQARSCNECPSGYFQSQTAQASCLPCIPGKLAYAVGTTNCWHCDKGTYVDTVAFNESECKKCPVGWYQNAEEATACIQCIPGTTAQQNASVECQMCESGRFTSLPGHTTQCTACGAGEYQEFRGATSCVSCIPGRYQTEEAQNSCKIVTKADSQWTQAETMLSVSHRIFSWRGEERHVCCANRVCTRRTTHPLSVMCARLEISRGGNDPSSCIACPSGFANFRRPATVQEMRGRQSSFPPWTICQDTYWQIPR